VLVQDLLADPVTAADARSQDGKAWYLPVGAAGTLGDPTAAESVQAVRGIAAEAFRDSSTMVRVTGPPAIVCGVSRFTPGPHSKRRLSQTCSQRLGPHCAAKTMPRQWSPI
jgi:hypothetical protein